MKGKLFLIPTYLDESNYKDFISPLVYDIILNTQNYLVENIRTARRFISSLELGIDISSLQFEQLDKRSSSDEIGNLCSPLLKGYDLGVISEAGLPGLADPGNLAVSWAHKNGVQVVPLPGSSSIQLALTGSGFNGQQFVFNGYLPIDKLERAKKLKDLEIQVQKTGYTQIFMETPFRNGQLLEAVFQNLNENSLLCIASGLTGKGEFIASKSIKQWKSSVPNLHKIPTIFCLGAFPG